MSAQHTPGPWRYLPEEGMIETETPINFRGEYDHICDFREPVSDANARLIAAAPELLDALKSMMAMIEAGTLVRDTSHDGDQTWYLPAMELTRKLASAQQAIAKATQP